MTAEKEFKQLISSVKACEICAPDFPHGVRPVLQINPQARILVAGQAPGAKVHQTGIPFDDASGDRLREWMGIDSQTFYDPEYIAILPMGFCYPGKGRSGDLPPKPVCAQTWRTPLMHALNRVKLILVIGQYAQAWHLPPAKRTLTETVRHWQDYDEHILPLPHPSPRNNIWLKKNPWFELELLPTLKTRVVNALK